MKFSVLIAHYNHWEYFQECYQSIEKQTYNNIEIIIVDDASTDGSYEKLKEFVKDKPNIKLHRNGVNKKVAFTKKKCIELSSGDICGFVDPDDFISCDAIEKSILEYKNTDVIATYSRIKLITLDSKEIGDFKNTKAIKPNQPLFFNINFEVAHFFTFKKNAYLKTQGLRSELIISEDQDLYLKLYEIGNFKFINEILYFYRIHDKGISQNKQKSNQQKQDWHNVLKDACNRRKIDKLYGNNVKEIADLPSYIFNKQNTIIKRIISKIIG